MFPTAYSKEKGKKREGEKGEQFICHLCDFIVPFLKLDRLFLRLPTVFRSLRKVFALFDDILPTTDHSSPLPWVHLIGEFILMKVSCVVQATPSLFRRRVHLYTVDTSRARALFFQVLSKLTLQTCKNKCFFRGFKLSTGRALKKGHRPVHLDSKHAAQKKSAGVVHVAEEHSGVEVGPSNEPADEPCQQK